MPKTKDTTTRGLSLRTYPLVSFKAFSALLSLGSPMKAWPFILPSFIKTISNLTGTNTLIHQHMFMKNSPLFTTHEKNRNGGFFSLALILIGGVEAADKSLRHETVVLTCFSPPLRRCRYTGRRWTSDPAEKIELGYIAGTKVRVMSS